MVANPDEGPMRRIYEDQEKRYTKSDRRKSGKFREVNRTQDQERKNDLERKCWQTLDLGQKPEV